MSCTHKRLASAATRLASRSSSSSSPPASTSTATARQAAATAPIPRRLSSTFAARPVPHHPSETHATLPRPHPVTIHPSTLPEFPPRRALGRAPKQGTVGGFFDVDEWASLQPPPESALAAFAHRIGLGFLAEPQTSTTTTTTTVEGTIDSAPKGLAAVLQACTHPSAVAPLKKLKLPEPATNGDLAALGNALLGMFAAEYVHSAYPHLPTRVMKAAVSAYVGTTTSSMLAREMGVTPLLRWHRTAATPLTPALLHADALATVPRALVGLVFTHRDLATARKFAHAFFLSRDVDLRSMIKFRDPKKALVETVKKFGRERPVSRLLKETGRLSISPVFVVGVYSGADKLGEGFGSSLKMAEFRAAEDALLRLYLTRTPPHQLTLPSANVDLLAFPPALEADAAYTPPELGEQETVYASAGRSSIVLGNGEKRRGQGGYVDEA